MYTQYTVCLHLRLNLQFVLHLLNNLNDVFCVADIQFQTKQVIVIHITLFMLIQKYTLEIRLY